MFCISVVLKFILSRACLVHLRFMLLLSVEQGFKLNVSLNTIAELRSSSWSDSLQKLL